MGFKSDCPPPLKGRRARLQVGCCNLSKAALSLDSENFVTNFIASASIVIA